MANRLLSVNILNFEHKTSELTFRFTTDEALSPIRVSRYDLPHLLPQLPFPSDSKELFVLFDAQSPFGEPLTKGVAPTAGKTDYWSYSLLKKYYLNLLFNFFKSQHLPCRIGFAKDLCVYVPAPSNYARCIGYREYRLRVQFGRMTQLPELVVSVADLHSVHPETMASATMQDIMADEFTWMLFRGDIYRYHSLSDEARRHPEEVFPFLNRNLIKQLSLTVPAPTKANRYVRYRNEIDAFKDKYLLNTELEGSLNFTSKSWVTLPSLRIADGEELKDELEFGNGRVHNDAYKGMPRFGPKELVPNRKRVFFFIVHQSDVAFALTIHKYMMGEVEGVAGLAQYAKITFTTQSKLSLFFNNRANPLPELKTYLQKLNKVDGLEYVAIYLSPISKQVEDAESKAVYFKVKEELLHHGIVSQGVEVDKHWGADRKMENNLAVLQSSFKFHLPNIAIALIAKLGGIPWGLKSKEIDELVIGVGAFRSVSQGANFLGSAFCFSGEGRFYGFDYFRSNEIKELVGSIIAAVRRYCEEHQTVRRLIIHFYKNMSREELIPIEQGLSKLGLPIPVYVISINKTEATDYFAFDATEPVLIPLTGTYLLLGESQYLLYNNTITTYNDVRPSSHFPFPLKVAIRYFPSDSLVAEPLAQATIPELLKQVILFSRLYWKSGAKQSLPVTIKYPEMLAEMAPHFVRPELPRTGKETLWFL